MLGGYPTQQWGLSSRTKSRHRPTRPETSRNGQIWTVSEGGTTCAGGELKNELRQAAWKNQEGSSSSGDSSTVGFQFRARNWALAIWVGVISRARRLRHLAPSSYPLAAAKLYHW